MHTSNYMKKDYTTSITRLCTTQCDINMMTHNIITQLNARGLFYLILHFPFQLRCITVEASSQISSTRMRWIVSPGERLAVIPATDKVMQLLLHYREAFDSVVHLSPSEFISLTAPILLLSLLFLD